MEKYNNERLTLKKFGISFSIGMAILFTAGIIRQFNPFLLFFIVIIAIFHLSFAFIKPEFLKPTHYVMSKLFFILGYIITNLVLILFFYLIFTPFAIILRIFNKDEIKNNSKFPHWKDINPEENDPKRIEKLY